MMEGGEGERQGGGGQGHPHRSARSLYPPGKGSVREMGMNEVRED